MVILNKLLLQNRVELISKTCEKWLVRGSKILDVGCGDGTLTFALKERFNLKITGTDIEDYRENKIPFVLMQKNNVLPFHTASFNSVLFNDVLHHTSKINQKALLLESLRVAKSNVLIFELKPTVSAYIGDFILNKIYHSAMKVPFTYRKKDQWIALFNEIPVKIEFQNIPRPFFSPFYRLAFCLKKESGKK